MTRAVSAEPVGLAPPTVSLGAFKQTEIGEIPVDWRVTRIADSCQKPEYGYTETATSDAVGPRFLRITDIQNQGVDWNTVPYCRCDEDRRQKHQLGPGDILFARIGATTGKSFLVRDCPDAVFASYLIRLRTKTVDPGFLYYFCNSQMYWKQIDANKGDKLKGGVSGSVLAELRHPLPPLPEQRAIAAVLSKIQAAVEVQGKIVATLKELKAATMAKLFREGLRGEPFRQTEIGEVPESWEIRRLGDIAHIGNGSTPKRTNPDYWERGTIPWLTSTKVHDVIIRRPSELVTELAARECHLPVVPKGSIVVAITGQGKTLGNAALVTFDTRINQHLAFVQVNDRNVTPEFVLTYLLYRYDDLRRAGTAGGSTKAALTCAYLETYPLPMPPLEEQRQIANTLLTIGQRQNAAGERRNALGSLFPSMLHLLMSGRVRLNGCCAACRPQVAS